jgi:hypothetical protein
VFRTRLFLVAASAFLVPPYRDSYFEYPPGAIPAFLAPLALEGLSYNLAFKVLVFSAGRPSWLLS